MTYTKDKKKALGAFYTPQVLSDLLARLLLPLCTISKESSITALDPATGDSILLESFEKRAKKKSVEVSLVGIDVDKEAIIKSKKKFGHNPKWKFIHTDALYPMGNSNPNKGWNALLRKYIPNGIDLIVSNPPWGADIDHYIALSRDFKSAIGQFDIYDLFIETIIENLKHDGVYGIIVPDSIYCQEHKKVREILLTNTTVKGIIRLGEGFFPDVNFAVSIIYGIKKSSSKYNVLCSHISNSDKKAIISGKSNIYTVVKEKAIKVPVKQMIDADFSFTVDVSQVDLPIINKLKANDTIKKYTSCQRGVELSKKGIIIQCQKCGEWFPKPRNKKKNTTCPHCKADVVIAIANQSCIVTNRKRKNSVPLITGEDIGRLSVSSNRYIIKGLKGIKYKSAALYQGPKVLVRKTGVGITAGIDYKNCFTNQVVYIIKPKSSNNPLITAEVIAAFLCSRVLTYVIIKEKGSIGWTSNPYLSQKDVCSLPFPTFDFSDEKTVDALKRITELVKNNTKVGKEIPSTTDAEIEKNIAYLYHIGKKEYDLIFKTIGQVEQMIPFSRLMKINSEDIFQNGI